MNDRIVVLFKRGSALEYSIRIASDGMQSIKEAISIMMVIRQFHPLVGGTEKQAELLAQTLKDSETKVFFLTARLQKEWKKNESIGGVEIVRVPSPHVKIMGTLLYALFLIYHLIKNRKCYDIVHVHRADYDAVVAIPISKLLRKKVLVKIACSGPFGDVEYLKNSQLGRFALRIIKRADRIIVLNEDIKKELLNVNFSKSILSKIPNCVNTNVFTSRISAPASKRKIVTCVGRLHEQKGLEYLLYSWKTLMRRIKLSIPSYELHLNMIGEGPLKNKLIDLAQALGVSKSIHFLGLISNVVDHLHMTDVFVNASIFEGISNSLLEAMACGVPIVATEISGNRELIQNDYNGLLVPPRDPVALCNAIENLLIDVEKAKKLGIEARITAERKFSSKIIAEEYRDLYRRLLGLSKEGCSLVQ